VGTLHKLDMPEVADGGTIPKGFDIKGLGKMLTKYVKPEARFGGHAKVALQPRLGDNVTLV